MTATDTTSHSDEPQALALDRLVRLISEEVEALLGNALPEAQTRQWAASPVPRPRTDTSERSKGVKSDPTPDIVADPRRLAVRATVVRAERVLRETAVNLRGVRRALERSVARYDGEV